jgi:hypothetical protein
MPDTKRGREEQAAHENRRQRELDVARALAAARDPEAEAREPAEDPDWPPACHRRGCNRMAAFVVRERYQEETGHGAVEAGALRSPEHTGEERPTTLDRADEDYVFRVESVPQGPDWGRPIRERDCPIYGLAGPHTGQCSRE